MIKVVTNSLFSDYEICTLEDVYKYCITKKIIGVDIETTRKFKKGTYSERVYKPGLDPYVTNIIMLQIGDLDIQFIIDTRQFHKSLIKKWICPLLSNKEILKVGHNLKFENKHFLHNYNCVLENIHDTFIVEKILYNGLNIGFSLEKLMNRYLGIKSVNSINLFEDYKPVKEKKFNKDDSFLLGLIPEEDEIMYVDKSTRTQFINWGDKPFTTKQIEYGAEDIIAPLKIYKLQILGRKIDGKKWYPINGIKIENAFVKCAAITENKGMPFNSLKWLEVYEANLKTYTKRLLFLNSWVVDKYPNFVDAVDLFNNTPRCAIEWSSSKQTIVFFKHLELCPKERSKSTKKIEYTVGAKSMFKLLSNERKNDFFFEKFPPKIIDNNDLILSYLLLKKAEQLVTTFGKDFLRYVHPITGRVHSNYNQLMNTGRLSSTSPNCLSASTEVLTKKGWKKGIDLVNKEEILSWNLSNKLEWTIPSKYYRSYSKVKRYYKTHYDIVMTDNHRCLFRDRRTNKFITKKAINFHKDAQILNSSILEKGISLDKNLIKFIVAIQADAHITKYNHLDFCFIKLRKYKRLVKILDTLNIPYKHINDKKRSRLTIKKDNWTIVNRYLTNKNFNWNLLELDLNSRKLLFNEIRYWDGNIKRHTQFTCKDKINVDIISAIASTIGVRTHFRYYINNDKKYPTIDITNHTDCTGTANTKIEQKGIEEVWCIEVNSGYFLARNNNQPFITGNCQNIPSTAIFRDCFSSGESMINCDYSGQESVLLADISEVPLLLDFYKNGHPIFGTDLHSYAATSMFRAILNDPTLVITKKTDKDRRDIAKNFNFKLA